VRGTWNVLEACRQAGVKQVLVASSDKAYGANPNLPYTETSPLLGRHPYDVSKSCADLISTMYAVSLGLPVTVVRCANLFGGGDMNFSRMLPDLIRSTLQGRPFEIRSDGEFYRDFLYARDAVNAYLMLAEALAGNPSFAGEAFNFGLGRKVRMLDLVELVLSLMGRPDLKPIVRNNASGEIREQYLSCERARRLLGWAPAYSLEQGLSETIAWYRDFLQVDVNTGASAMAGA
jgi:CDP-glucose 4,6-dehydratase